MHIYMHVHKFLINYYISHYWYHGISCSASRYILQLTQGRFRFPTFSLSSWINWCTLLNNNIKSSRPTFAMYNYFYKNIMRCIMRYIRIAFPNAIPKPFGWIGRQQCAPFIRWVQVDSPSFFLREDKEGEERFIIPPRTFVHADHGSHGFLHRPSHEFNTRLRVWMRARARIVSFVRLFVAHCFEARCHFTMAATSRCLKRFSWR